MFATLFDALYTFVTTTLVNSLLDIALTVLFVAAGLGLIKWGARKAYASIEKQAMDDNRRARLRTVISTAKNTLRVIVFALAAISVLASFGVDLTALMAAAGIAGLGISLGAQTLIKDYFGGITILLEDQYRVGDNISVNGVDGSVERVTLRRTDLRTADGTLMVVPNGEIRTVGNNTRDWSRATVELNLAYDADINEAVSALNGAMARAAADPQLSTLLLEQPEILGWNQTNDFGVRVRMQAKVKPGQQWAVARQLRRMALDALHEANIRIAQPYQQFSTQPQTK